MCPWKQEKKTWASDLCIIHSFIPYSYSQARPCSRAGFISDEMRQMETAGAGPSNPPGVLIAGWHLLGATLLSLHQGPQTSTHRAGCGSACLGLLGAHAPHLYLGGIDPTPGPRLPLPCVMWALGPQGCPFLSRHNQSLRPETPKGPGEGQTLGLQRDSVHTSH